MALANIAQKMNEQDAGPLMNEHFVDRIIKLAVTNEVDLHEEIATLLRNLSFYPAFAKLLRDRGAIVAIAVLRKSMFASVRDSGQIAAQNLMGNSADANLAQKQAAILDSFEPLEATVTWDTWGSKLDNIFSPVFAGECSYEEPSDELTRFGVFLYSNFSNNNCRRSRSSGHRQARCNFNRDPEANHVEGRGLSRARASL
jgi:hypothetical protein